MRIPNPGQISVMIMMTDNVRRVSERIKVALMAAMLLSKSSQSATMTKKAAETINEAEQREARM